MPDEKKPELFKLEGGAPAYEQLYNYVKIIKNLEKGDANTLRILHDVAPKLFVEGHSSTLKTPLYEEELIKAIGDHRAAFGLGRMSDTQYKRITTYAYEAAGKHSLVPPLEEVDKLYAAYIAENEDRRDRSEAAYREAKGKVKESKKNVRKAGWRMAGAVTLGALSMALTLGVVGAVGVGIWQVVSTALAGSFGIASGFAVGGVAMALIFGRFAIKGVSKLFKVISERFKAAREARKKAKQAYKSNVKTMNKERANFKAAESTINADKYYESTNPYPGKVAEHSREVVTRRQEPGAYEEFDKRIGSKEFISSASSTSHETVVSEQKTSGASENSSENHENSASVEEEIDEDEARRLENGGGDGETTSTTTGSEGSTGTTGSTARGTTGSVAAPTTTITKKQQRQITRELKNIYEETADKMLAQGKKISSDSDKTAIRREFRRRIAEYCEENGISYEYKPKTDSYHFISDLEEICKDIDESVDAAIKKVVEEREKKAKKAEREKRKNAGKGDRVDETITTKPTSDETAEPIVTETTAATNPDAALEDALEKNEKYKIIKGEYQALLTDEDGKKIFLDDLEEELANLENENKKFIKGRFHKEKRDKQKEKRDKQIKALQERIAQIKEKLSQLKAIEDATREAIAKGSGATAENSDVAEATSTDESAPVVNPEDEVKETVAKAIETYLKKGLSPEDAVKSAVDDMVAEDAEYGELQERLGGLLVKQDGVGLGEDESIEYYEDEIRKKQEEREALKKAEEEAKKQLEDYWKKTKEAAEKFGLKVDENNYTVVGDDKALKEAGLAQRKGEISRMRQAYTDAKKQGNDAESQIADLRSKIAGIKEIQAREAEIYEKYRKVAEEVRKAASTAEAEEPTETVDETAEEPTGGEAESRDEETAATTGGEGYSVLMNTDMVQLYIEAANKYIATKKKGGYTLTQKDIEKIEEMFTNAAAEYFTKNPKTKGKFTPGHLKDFIGVQKGETGAITVGLAALVANNYRIPDEIKGKIPEDTLKAVTEAVKAARKAGNTADEELGD